MSGIVVVGLLVDCKSEASILSGEAGLVGIFEVEEIGERKVTTRLVGEAKPEGVNIWKSSSGLERTERQSLKEEKLSVVGPGKRIRTNLNREDWSHGLVELSRTQYGAEVLSFFLSILSHIM